MWFGPVELSAAVGTVLAHNIAGVDGARAFRKGRVLSPDDIAILAAMGRTDVYVARLDPDDVDENRAARRIGAALSGPGLKAAGAASGRNNLLAAVRGVFRVDVERLARLNLIDGLTVATLHGNNPVRPRQIAATVKIVPFALPEANVAEAEAIAREEGPILQVDPLPAARVAVVFSGSQSIKDRLLDDFAPLIERLEGLDARVVRTDFVTVETLEGERALTRLLETLRSAVLRPDLLVLAGETAIMDRHDSVPRALEGAGGNVEVVGAPVDPGNLLMLGDLDGIPVLGAPGCARSRKLNVIDWVLPRLLVGDRVSRAEIAALGHGGLLEDAPERPHPRTHPEP